MLSVHKFPLRLADDQFIDLPSGATILAVQDQRGRLCIWALVDTEEKSTTPRRILIVGTGMPVPDVLCRTYLGTVQQEEGSLVWHLFEVD